MTLCQCGCGQPAPISRNTDRRKGAVMGQPRPFQRGHHMRVMGILPATKQKMAAGRPRGEAHPAWKGDDVGYCALHDWVNRHGDKTGACVRCSAEGITHWANISGKYLRDLDDFIELCVPCHKQFDMEGES